MTKDNKKKNNKSNNDTTTKHPASSSPTGNISGQGSSSSGPSNTLLSTTSTNKCIRVSTDDYFMNVDKPLTPPGPVETTFTDASQHASTNNNDKGKSSYITPTVSFPECTASLDTFKAAVQSQPTFYYASAASNDVEGF
ncbi:hypothetical protein RhiirC2_788058 [Rhizophagus irregularis]|uniref:Uncharacterized protein n=1 Tax=Rhizophagus irregularis TaxID=588596 RepID=A0A2N1MQX1_9GLOM|nr:hypothetical protein RhiirC2_788058 [Rhizophagus irregularis]